MSDETSTPNNPSKADDLLVADILKAAFHHEGIECESAVCLRWRIIDDEVHPVPIVTLGDLFREFQDGSYQFAVTRARISIVGRATFEIPTINVEASFSDGKWLEPRIYHDEETSDTDHETDQALHARGIGARENVKSALDWFAIMVRIAQNVRDLFS